MKHDILARTVNWLVILCCGCTLNGQGTFQNLDFESGVVVPIPGSPFGEIQFMPAFPGWTGTVAGQNQTTALYNNRFQTLPYFALIDSGSTVGGPIQGSHTALFGANINPISGSTEASLFQTGLVPIDSLSLRFLAFPPRNGFTILLNGTPLAYLNLGMGNPGPNTVPYNLYAADVSGFAGQVAELKFTVVTDPVLGRASDIWLDSLAFSSNPIPEPSTWALLALGSALFWCVARRRRK